MSSLTGFIPVDSELEHKDEGLRGSFTKLFKRSKGPNLSVPATAEVAVGSEAKKEDESFCVLSLDREESPARSLSTPSSCSRAEDFFVGRTPANVLKMVKSLLAVGGQGDDSVNDADRRKHWLPDEMASTCYECSKKFSTFLRRHHCRICGLIFCSKCCNLEIRGKVMGFVEDLRVCDYCYKFTLKYLQSVNAVEGGKENRSFQEDMQSFDDSQSDIGSIGRSRRTSMCIFDDYLRSSPTTPLPTINAISESSEQHPLSGAPPIKELRSHQLSAEERRSLVQDSAQLKYLRNLLADSATGVELKIHRNRLKTYHHCCTGKDIVDWLIGNDRAASRMQATAIAQALLEAGYLESLTNQEFSDSLALYKPIASRSQRSQRSRAPVLTPEKGKEEPQWVRQITEEMSSRASFDSTFGMNLAASLTDMHIHPGIEPVQTVLNLPEHFDDAVTEGQQVMKQRPGDLPLTGEVKKLHDEGLWVPDTPGAIEADPDAWLGESPALAEDELREVKRKLNEAYRGHELKLLQQLMSHEGLAPSWTETVQRLVHSIVTLVKPDVRHGDDIDLRSYVKVKKVPGGRREESRVVSGMVITKSVAHRSMYSSFKNPRIILISGGVDFLQQKSKLTSLDSIAAEESDYYRKTVSKIESWQPDVVICSRPVSRIAQESLRQRAITLVLSVKFTVLEKLAKVLAADIVTSVDFENMPPRGGTCTDFFVQNFLLECGKSKSLMFFEKKDEQNASFSSVILRGGTYFELVKVKRVLHCMTLVAYNWRFERSFLCDEMAVILDFSACSESESENEDTIETICGDFDIVGTRLSSAHEAVEDFRLTESTDSDAVFLECDRRRRKGKDKLLKRQITDNSDPLHSPKMPESASVEKLAVVDISVTPRVGIQSILGDVALSSSPLLSFPLPYLETPIGRNSKLRKFFPAELFLSKLLGNRPVSKVVDVEKRIDKRKTNLRGSEVVMKEPHPFLSEVISPNSEEMMGVAADFRARGGTYCLKRTVVKEVEKRDEDPGQEAFGDPLDPRSHQKLQVLFSSHSAMSLNMPHSCVAPWLMTINFYGKSDLTLGSFLERLCFRADELVCPSETCRTSMVSHIRRFVHGDACIHVILRKLENPLPARDGAILVWTYCKKCKSLSAVTTLSDDAWHLSFAKYLELRFYGHVYRRRGGECPHRLHVDHYQYFGMGDMVASMKYSPITLRELCLPSVNIQNFPCDFLLKHAIDEIRHLTQIGAMVYSGCKEWLQALGVEFSGTKHESAVTGLLLQLDAEKSLFKDKVDDIQILLSSPTLGKKSTDVTSQEDLLYEIIDRETILRKIISDTAQTWNARLQDLIQHRKKDEKSRTGSKLQPTPTSGNFDFRPDYSESDGKTPSESDYSDVTFKSTSQGGSGVTSSPSRSRRHFRNASTGSATSRAGAFDGRTRSDSSSPIRPPMSEDLRREHHRTSLEGAKVSASRDSSPETFKPSDKKLSVSTGTATPSGLTHSSTVKNLLSGLLSSSQTVPIQLPFLASEHHLLPPNGSFPLSIYESEPSSIIAFALSSTDYEAQLAQLSVNATKAEAGVTKLEADRSRPQTKEPRKTSDPKKEPDSPMGDASDEGDNGNNPAHIEVQFPDSTANFYCKIYFAAAFKQLRSLVMPDDETGFIRSLSRSASWAAAGGKSGSTFSKTLDDRFVIKQMNRHEVESLIDIAPSYVSYMSRSILENRPTALCKVLGAYKIVYRNNVTGAASKQDVLVMENLFYKREISATYDLKGSVRNRMVATTGRSAADLVMLDENLLQVTVDNPFYIRPHSSSVLKVSLSRDTQFLASHLIMDYSLLVGVDDKNDEFVVGIIDYMRTFTWDKKLETFVKSSGLLGGQGKQPTIVSPDLYRNRFCDAMSRYFLAVPDRWTGLSSTADC